MSKLLDILTRVQASATPIDMEHGDEDARIPAGLWREFVDAHADLIYEESRSPSAWIATSAIGKVLHFAKSDGWRVEAVSSEPSPSAAGDADK